MKTILYTFGLLALTLLFGADVLAQGAITVEPLTDIGVETGSQENIGAFVNQLYQYGVGIGAILAVLIIMYGGFRYMTSEAVGEKSAGRDDIQRAILGLLLLLSPVIVFGIINQDILNLNFNLDRLQHERNAIDNGEGNTPSVPNFCQDYTSFRKVELESGQECRDVLGVEWIRLGQACCDTAGATGSGSCCGFDPERTPAEHRLSYAAPIEQGGELCRLDEDREYETLTECTADANFLTSDHGAAVIIACDGTFPDPPSPLENWNAVKDLDYCQ